ncbi:hypothetical protein C0991_009711, partial [Blastosporella zonata]
MVFVDGLSHSRHTLARRGNGLACKDGFMTSQSTKRLFMFSELELTDDDQFLHTATADLGDIKLLINRCKRTAIYKGSGQPSQSQKATYDYSEPEKVHERSKKAMGHRFKLGPEIPHTVGKSSHKTKVLEKIATFIFKYRPLAQLQANGIIPLEQKRKRATEPVDTIDLSRDDVEDDDSDDQRIQALQEELLLLKQRQKKCQKGVKTELDDTKVKAEVKVEG